MRDELPEAPWSSSLALQPALPRAMARRKRQRLAACKTGAGGLWDPSSAVIIGPRVQLRGRKWRAREAGWGFADEVPSRPAVPRAVCDTRSEFAVTAAADLSPAMRRGQRSSGGSRGLLPAALRSKLESPPPQTNKIRKYNV